MPPALRRDLEQRARRLGVRVKASVSDPLSYVQAADVVVAMAGYSSTAELLRSGTPAVLVPRSGPSAEQRMRASRFTNRGWVGMVDPDQLSGAAVAAAVRDRLVHLGDPPPRPDGLDAAVGVLLSQLSRQVVVPAQYRAPKPLPVE
jgi:predicted glycosyltransferase